MWPLGVCAQEAGDSGFLGALFLNGSTVAVGGFEFGGDVTVEAWVMARSAPYNSRVVEMGTRYAASAVIGLGFYRSTGKLVFTVRNNGESSGAVVSPQVLPTNAWVHVAVTLSAGRADMYWDAQLRATGDVPAPVVSVRPFAVIGQSLAPSGAYFDGMVDDLRLWDVARSAIDIEVNMLGLPPSPRPMPGLALLLEFDELLDVDDFSKAPLTDSSGHGRTATLHCTHSASCMLPVSTAAKIVCGDGKQASAEECDDGNNTPGDGCAADCTIEDGHMCLKGLPGATDVCTPGSVSHTDRFEGTSTAAWGPQVGSARSDATLTAGTFELTPAARFTGRQVSSAAVFRCS